MGSIEKGTRDLLAAIKESDEYKEYKRTESEIMNHPLLFDRINLFRANNFRFQNEANHDLFYAADQVFSESRELQRIPEANAYLQAELALCRLIQNIYKDMAEGIDMHIPYL